VGVGWTGRIRELEQNGRPAACKCLILWWQGWIRPKPSSCQQYESAAPARSNRWQCRSPPGCPAHGWTRRPAHFSAGLRANMFDATHSVLTSSTRFSTCSCLPNFAYRVFSKLGRINAVDQSDSDLRSKYCCRLNSVFFSMGAVGVLGPDSQTYRRQPRLKESSSSACGRIAIRKLEGQPLVRSNGVEFTNLAGPRLGNFLEMGFSSSGRPWRSSRPMEGKAVYLPERLRSTPRRRRSTLGDEARACDPGRLPSQPSRTA
jgi:hypothetical protein